MFTKQELQSLLLLISRTDIKGSEAMNVVMLQQKISGYLNEGSKEASPAKPVKQPNAKDQK